jgi:thiamine pyrophosphokinase
MNNIQLLIQTAEANIPCVIEDERNRISIVDPNRKVSVNKSRFENISLIPLSTVVKGITISGFKYLLQDATFVQGKAYGISNVLIEEVGSVEVKEGYLLVIESND